MRVNKQIIVFLVAFSSILLALNAAGFALRMQPVPIIPQSTSEWVNVTNNIGGEKWGYAGVTMVAAIPRSKNIIGGVSEHGLWITSDEGATWRQLGEDGQIKHRPYHIVFSRKNPRTFWVSGHYGPGLFKTTNGGKSFMRIGDKEHTDCVGIDQSDDSGQTILLGRHETGKRMYLSTTGGTSWTEIGVTLPDKSGNANHVMVLGPKTFVVGVSQYGPTVNGVYKTTDAGQTWTNLTSSASTGIPVTASDGTIYWPCSHLMLVSKDKSSSWDSVPIPGGGQLVEAGPGRLLNAAGKQMMISTNGGASWSPVGPPIPFSPNSITYSEQSHTIYVSHFTDTKSPSSVYRLSLL